MVSKAACAIPGSIKDAALVKATGRTHDRKETIKRTGATWMTHAGKFWAWDLNACDLANEVAGKVPGIGARTCVVAALVTPDEVARHLDAWHARPLDEWGGAGKPDDRHESKARARRQIINRDLGITLDEDDDNGKNVAMIRRALQDPDTLKHVVDRHARVLSPRMACIEPSPDLVKKVMTGKARVVPSTKYGFGYGERYEEKVKSINRAIIEILA